MHFLMLNSPLIGYVAIESRIRGNDKRLPVLSFNISFFYLFILPTFFAPPLQIPPYCPRSVYFICPPLFFCALFMLPLQLSYLTSSRFVSPPKFHPQTSCSPSHLLISTAVPRILLPILCSAHTLSCTPPLSFLYALQYC